MYIVIVVPIELKIVTRSDAIAIVSGLYMGMMTSPNASTFLKFKNRNIKKGNKKVTSKFDIQIMSDSRVSASILNFASYKIIRSK